MPYAIDTTIVVRLDGTPAAVEVRWEAPDGTFRKVSEELPESAEMSEAETMVDFIRDAIEADPF